jgi:hypothetical protein
MSDNRRNLQVGQPGIEGNETVDNNGWPTPLNDRTNTLKVVITDGKRGQTKDFRAMSTSGQGELSLPEGHSHPSKDSSYDSDLTIKVKKTVGNSLA